MLSAQLANVCRKSKALHVMHCKALLLVINLFIYFYLVS